MRITRSIVPAAAFAIAAAVGCESEPEKPAEVDTSAPATSGNEMPSYDEFKESVQEDS